MPNTWCLRHFGLSSFVDAMIATRSCAMFFQIGPRLSKLFVSCSNCFEPLVLVMDELLCTRTFAALNVSLRWVSRLLAIAGIWSQIESLQDLKYDGSLYPNTFFDVPYGTRVLWPPDEKE